ncbi:hypothetical protein HWV62_31513 [Athelia sp. TMB]|nr:hypothetical protein HWV62_31513 [Athelia sp. TMB]
MSSTTFALYYRARRRERLTTKFHLRPIELRSDEILSGVTGLIGNTPLVRINSLSDALGVEILGKAEFLNPGGSVKDRVALRTIIMPDDVAEEKVKALHALGADVQRVRPASIVDKKQYVNIAREAAVAFGRETIVEDHLNHGTGTAADSYDYVLPTLESSVVVSTTSNTVEPHSKSDEDELRTRARGFFADQFEASTISLGLNFDAHFDGTGPEIWRQTNSQVDAFVAGAGTGGTIAGTGQYIKSMNEDVKIVLADPEGSGLFNKVKHGVMFDIKEKEGTKRRHQVDTVVEGIWMKLTLSVIDRVTDAEAVKNDGLFLGSSSACNLVACVKYVRKMGWNNGQHVVTILLYAIMDAG